jgi:heptosyltransferase III
MPLRILLVRNDRLGDTMLALPAISLLQQALPEAEIIFLAAPAMKPLLECVKGIDLVISASDRGAEGMISKLKNLKIKTAFCLRATFANAKVLYRAEIPERIGTGRRWFSFLFNYRVNLSRRKSDRHEADLNLELLRAYGLAGAGNFPTIDLPQTAFESVKELLERSGISATEKFVVVHPGSGGSARDWPVAYFKALANLFRDQQVQVVVTGVPNETSICREVAGKRHLDLSGKTTLIELATLLSMAEMIVAPSTGPLHLAVALGRPVMGLYPPVRDCLPTRWGPYRHSEWALMPDLPLCSRCTPGAISNCRCMEQITPEQVFQQAMMALSESDCVG